MNAEQIRLVRIANGIMQKDFAELIGVPIGTWANVETGRQPLYDEARANAVRVIKELDCDLSILDTGISFGKATKAFRDTLADVTKSAPKEEEKSIFHQIAEEIADVLARKNHDYGDSFHDIYEEFGDLSTYMRLTDKMGRLKSMVQGKEMKVDDEPLVDVYRDIAGYCILTLVSRQRLEEDGGM